MNAILIDTETNTKDDAEPIEVAWADWDFGPIGEVHLRLFKPRRPIEPGAALVHGILPCDLEGDGIEPSNMAPAFPRTADYWIAHNVDFDWEAMGSPPVKRICTLSLARSIWPDFGCHKLGAIIYELRGMTAETREMLSGIHGAGEDVKLLAFVLDAIVDELGVSTLDSLWDESELARIPKTISFGKHSGELIEDLPVSYVRWLLQQDWIDPYLRKALE